MLTFLLVVHAIIAASLVTVILMQRSEGGGLGMGSGPSGLMTARGAADFLTRATSILAAMFVLMALALAAYASMRNRGGDIDTSLAHQAAPGPINVPVAPTSAIPLMGAAPAPAAPDNLTTLGAAPANGAEAAPKATPAPHVVPSVKSLHTIDTHAGNSTVGINGVGSGPVGNTSASAKTAPVVTLPAIKPPASAPAKTDTAPAVATGTGNSTQP
jgi:preprotein translocase subunit SecG